MLSRQTGPYRSILLPFSAFSPFFLCPFSSPSKQFSPKASKWGIEIWMFRLWAREEGGGRVTKRRVSDPNLCREGTRKEKKAEDNLGD